MGVERRPEGGSGADHGDSSDRGTPTDADGSSGPVGSASRVHVRRLDVVDTLRWSWEMLGDHRELVGVALAVNLLSVVAALGITRPTPSAKPEFADWVPWLYLVQLFATLVVWGVVYLTASAAVANRSRPLARHLVGAFKRLPALVATAVVMGVLVGLSLLPAVGVLTMDWANVAIGLFLTLVLALAAVYVFHRLLLAYPACVIDRKGPVASARASWRAATGNVGKVFAVSAVYVVAVGVVHAIVTGASNVVSSQFDGLYDVSSALVSAAFSAVLLPVFALAVAHLYLEGSRNQ